MADQNEKTRDHSPQYEIPGAEHMSVARYLGTRISTLKPPMNRAPNPIKLLCLLHLQQWLFFLVAFFAWSWDAFDFFTVSLTIEQLADEFGKSASQITWGITLVLSMSSHRTHCMSLADQVLSVPLCGIYHFRYVLSKPSNITIS